MPKPKYELVLLPPAQYELEEIAILHLALVGPNSARKITGRVHDALENLRTFPEMGFACRDDALHMGGYRMLICGNYLCVYRLLDKTVYVYHIVDCRSNYPLLLAELDNL